MGRTLLALVVGLLLATQIVRNSAVKALVDTSPDKASAIWPANPDSRIALAMTEIARSARERKPVDASVFAMIGDAARKAPLAAEPFLVRGVQAQLRGERDLAIAAFSGAERRDPRSLPAHYFLADALFQAGDARRGLEEVGILAGLAPNGATSVAPYLAAYAKNPANWPQLRTLFRSNLELQNIALTAMAADAGNAGAVMALVTPELRNPDPKWAPTLLSTLIDAGQYRQARAIWASIAGVRLAAGETVHDEGFTDSRSPPPFNWALMSSTVGLAERRAGGQLHVIFYGQEDGLLARQLLLLAPGRYRMSMAATGAGEQARALTWSIRCDRSQSPFAAMPLDIAAARSWTFQVPTGCPAQWLELSGVSAEVARQSDVIIRGLSLKADRPNG